MNCRPKTPAKCSAACKQTLWPECPPTSGTVFCPPGLAARYRSASRGPGAPGGTLPAILYSQGGGWVLGDQDTHDRLIREIANGAPATVVFVNYTSSPEAQCPVPIEEAYAAPQSVAEHGSEIYVDTSRPAAVGDSVGGDMAAAVTLLAKERGRPPVCLRVLFHPVTEAGFDTPSYDQFAQGCRLTREAMKWFWDQYAPDPAVRSEPTAAPLQASVDQLGGLPPALISGMSVTCCATRARPMSAS